MTIIVNGAPHYVDLGTKDSSGLRAVRLAISYPQHLPKWYILAQKGTEAPWLGGSVERLNQYGDKTFDERSAYYTHQTEGSNVSNETGNIGIYQRIVPDDAGPRANLVLWLDLLPTLVDDFERMADGSIKLVDGVPVVIGQIPAFKYEWTRSFETTKEGAEGFGTRTQQVGRLIDPANPSVRSVKYPVLEQRVSSRGKWGNDIGENLWGLDNRVDTIPEKMVNERRVFPYGIRMMERDTELGTVKTLNTATGAEQVIFTLKPMTLDPSTDADSYLAAAFQRSYFQTDTRYPVQSPALSDMVIYQDNIDAVLLAAYNAERPYIVADIHDFIDAGDDEAKQNEEKYLFNLFGGRTLAGVPYRTFVPVVGTLSMDRSQTVYAGGGSDGTLNYGVVEKGMIADVRNYRDANHPYQDKAYYIESHMYDTGYTLNGKKEMAAFISIRGDTFVTFGTFQEGERSFDASEELSIASSLKATLANLPESTYFNTPVVRAGIYGGDALRRGQVISKRVSSVMEVIHKRSKYLGASDGKWKSGAAYDQGAPGSVCEILYDFSRLWTPTQVRYRFWDAGLNWWGHLNREQNFCPAFRTVYSDDTSLLTADTYAMALIFANRVNDRSWRVHSGTTGVDAPVFLKRITDYINGEVNGKTDGRYPMEPVPTITGEDAKRGYSWHSGINIFGDPMRTVAVNYSEAFRSADRANASQLGATFD